MKHSETFFTNKVHCLVNFTSYKKYPIAALTLISFCDKLLMLSYYLHIRTFTKNSSNVPHGLYRWWQLNWQIPFKTLSINYHDYYDITILINGCFLFDNARWVTSSLKVCRQFPLRNCVQLWHNNKVNSIKQLHHLPTQLPGRIPLLILNKFASTMSVYSYVRM